MKVSVEARVMVNRALRASMLPAILVLAMGAPAQDASGRLVPETVLVNQNDVVITVDDVAQYLNFNLSPEARPSGLERERAVKQIVENLYVLERLHQQALKRGGPFARRVDWVSRYEGIRFAAVKYMKQAEEASKEEAALDWEGPAREYYLANIEEFSSGDRRDVSHILVAFDGRSFDSWQERVALVRQELASGEVFEEVAREFSDDEASARYSGSLGIISKGQMVPAFEQAAFDLAEVGAVSDPIFTPYGLHIIQLNAKLPSELRDFESVKFAIKPKVVADAPANAKEALLLPFKQEVGGTIAVLDESAIVDAVRVLLLSD